MYVSFYYKKTYRVVLGMGNIIQLSKGNQRELEFQILNDDGTPAVISGADLKFTVKQSLNDSDSRAYISKTLIAGNDAGIEITEGTQGKGVIKFDASDTQDMPSGEYYFDLKIQDSSTIQSLNTPGIFRLLAVVTQL